MLKLVCLLSICLTGAASANHQRIVGGSITNIGQYPFAAVVIVTDNQVNFRQNCGGTIINNRSIMSAAHCWWRRVANQFRIRVGSTNASSGGSLHIVGQLITHPNYNTVSQDNDIGILRVTTAFVFGNNVRAGGIAGANFNVADNRAVWAIGWGLTSTNGAVSEQLRHVQLVTVNQEVCRRTWSTITANMMCAGWAAGGRATCSIDSGGPLIYNNVIVGVTSMGSHICGDGLPEIYVRISRVSNWIRANA